MFPKVHLMILVFKDCKPGNNFFLQMNIFSLTFFSQASVLIPVSAGFIYYNNLKRPFRILFYFFCFSFFIEIGAEIMARFYRNSMPLLHFFTVPEFLMFLYVFLTFFMSTKNRNALFYCGLASILIFALLDMFFWDGPYKFNSVARSFESLVLVLLSLVFYFTLFKEHVEISAWKLPMFWFSTSVLIYFSLNLFFFMLANLLHLIDGSPFSFGNQMHSIVNIFANTLFAISFRCIRATTI